MTQERSGLVTMARDWISEASNAWRESRRVMLAWLLMAKAPCNSSLNITTSLHTSNLDTNSLARHRYWINASLSEVARSPPRIQRYKRLRPGSGKHLQDQARSRTWNQVERAISSGDDLATPNDSMARILQDQGQQLLVQIDASAQQANCCLQCGSHSKRYTKRFRRHEIRCCAGEVCTS